MLNGGGYAMRPTSNRTNIYILLLAVIVAAITAYYLPTKRPQNASMMSPKDYIELVEQKKAQRLHYEQEQEQRRQPDSGEPRTGD